MSEDDMELSETIAFIGAFLPMGLGFQVSDPDHAEQVFEWLRELKERREAPIH